jgi:hypothetical protein
MFELTNPSQAVFNNLAPQNGVSFHVWALNPFDGGSDDFECPETC